MHFVAIICFFPKTKSHTHVKWREFGIPEGSAKTTQPIKLARGVASSVTFPINLTSRTEKTFLPFSAIMSLERPRMNFDMQLTLIIVTFMSCIIAHIAIKH